MKNLFTLLALALALTSCSKNEETPTPQTDNADQYAVTYMSMTPGLISNTLLLDSAPLTELASYGGNLGLYSFNAVPGGELILTVKGAATLADVYFLSFYKYDKASKSMVLVSSKTLPKGTALPYTFKILLN